MLACAYCDISCLLIRNYNRASKAETGEYNDMVLLRIIIGYNTIQFLQFSINILEMLCNQLSSC